MGVKLTTIGGREVEANTQEELDELTDGYFYNGAAVRKDDEVSFTNAPGRSFTAVPVEPPVRVDVIKPPVPIAVEPSRFDGYLWEHRSPEEWRYIGIPARIIVAKVVRSRPGWMVLGIVGTLPQFTTENAAKEVVEAHFNADH
jgi:hypothetical protein